MKAKILYPFQECLDIWLLLVKVGNICLWHITSSRHWMCLRLVDRLSMLVVCTFLLLS